MKWFLVFWATPIVLITGWYGLSYYDMNFGIFMLTRQAHDLVFKVYGDVLGIPPETIPPVVLRAIVVDSLVVFGIIAFRRRRQIAAWWRNRTQRADQDAQVTPLANIDNLSSAP